MERTMRTVNGLAMPATGLCVLLNIWIKCRKGMVVLLIVGLAMMAGAPVASAVSYTGSLTTSDNGLLGTGDWVDAPQHEGFVTILSWVVQDGKWNTSTGETDPAGTEAWKYCYDFETTAQGGLSHIIIEVTPPDPASPEEPYFTANNVLWASASWELKVYSPSDPGNSNPGLPGDIYGLKFAGNSATSDTICLLSDIGPTWRDAYAKDGNAGDSGVNAMWNAGFLVADPVDVPADGSVAYHILGPDSEPGGGQPPIPEPSTLALVVLGAVGGMVNRRRRG